MQSSTPRLVGIPRRRVVACCGAVFAALAIASHAAPAGAHSCSVPSSIEPRRPQTVNIGIAAEEIPMESVVIHVPTGFDVISTDAPDGWSASRPGRDIEFSGGRIAAFACGYFALTGTADKVGTLLFTATARAADGSVREFRARDQRDPQSAQLVRVGAAGDGSDRDSSLRSSERVVTIFVVVVAMTGVAVIWVTGSPRKWRRRGRTWKPWR